MKETAWRLKLVNLFKQRQPKGFIWAHDAHFKTGFPDLTVVMGAQAFWIELKRIAKIEHDPLKKLMPTQVDTLRRLDEASGMKCLVLARADDSGDVRAVSLNYLFDTVWNNDVFHKDVWGRTFPFSNT